MSRDEWPMDMLGAAPNAFALIGASFIGDTDKRLNAQPDGRLVYRVQTAGATQAVSRRLSRVFDLSGAFASSAVRYPDNEQPFEIFRNPRWETDPLSVMKFVVQSFRREWVLNAAALSCFDNFNEAGVRPGSILAIVNRTTPNVHSFCIEIGDYLRLPAASVHIDASLNRYPNVVLGEHAALRNVSPRVSAINSGELNRAHGAGPITINYAPVVQGSGLDERQLLRVLERHARELHRIISRQEERYQRLAFT
jgi:hypothetical protein